MTSPIQTGLKEGIPSNGVRTDMRPDDRPTPADLRARLGLLALEREAAQRSPLADDSHYMVGLREEIAAVESAYVGAAVIEIATLRADLSGALVG
jgi:hypothetical protein